MLYIILLFVILVIFLAIRHKKWWLMAVCSAVLYVMSTYGIQGIENGIGCAEEYVNAHEMHLWRILLLLTLAMATALIINKKEYCSKEREAKKVVEERFADVGVSGFTADNECQSKSGWNNFVRLLCERLTKTKLQGESFALGIAGEWGSGKTTFLKQMKPELEKTFKVIEFNPWACMNSKSIAADFFDALKEQIPQRNQSLQSEITQYVRLIVGAGIVPNALETIVEFVVGSEAASVSSLKASIGSKLEKAETRYVVLMDDLDRLESQELFETLRLIRVTASFSNILFVVAYDRHHIVDMLSANRISNGEQFIKKIFSTEIVIPEMEPYTMPTLLMDEIKRLVGNDSSIPHAIEAAVYSKDSLDTYDLLEYLRNYRDVKRFAMAFSVDAYAVEKNTPGEFSYSDFFWLEILRYVDYDVYDDLRTNPLMYLQRNDVRLVAKENIETLLESKMQASAIIKKVFVNTDSPCKINGVSFVNNFRNYFSFRVQDNKLSRAEFETLLGLDNMNVMKNKLANYRMQGKLQSLYVMVRQTELKNLQDAEMRKKYLSLLFSLVPFYNYNYSSTIKDKLKEDSYDENDKNIMAEHVKTLINGMVNDDEIRRGTVNLIISQLYSRYYVYDMDENGGGYDYKCIVDDEFLVKASENNMRIIFEVLQDLV